MKRTSILILLVAGLSGCLDLFDDEDTFGGPLSATDFAAPTELGTVTADDIQWPDFTGATLRILDHGAFGAFDEAASRFENLTGAHVEHFEAADTGRALQMAIEGKGDPEFDVLYGIDNILLWKARQADILQPYQPVLAPRIDPAYRFDTWDATPVDHGYIALNIDSDHAAFDDGAGNLSVIEDLGDVRAFADRFVTQDPHLSTPGLGFMLITISVYGEDDAYDWLDYWQELFDHGVKVVPDWSEAYETYFTGGYGIYTDGHQGGYPIVTSYTESPAYEAYYGATDIADVLLESDGRPAVFHQVQTMAVLDGAPNRAVAEAWIEFTLTDDFQALAAPWNAVYPVVSSVGTDSVYGGLDPTPGSFGVVDLDPTTIGQNLDGWLDAWEALCERHACR